jgi:DNA-binding transcriptional regulator YbjK
MAPLNHARRERLGDAAIEILASAGARGLTHRAVDVQAGEPAGTTSRYFRTRDALLTAAAERARDLHFADLRAERPDLPSIVQDALGANRSRHLAMFELFLESTRRPALRETLTEIRRSQIELVQQARSLTETQATGLICAITGLVVIGLTTPSAIGTDDVERLMRAWAA